MLGLKLAKKNSKGFSLIELMVVVSIIGIIAAIAVPSYQSSMRKGRASTVQGDLLALAQKVEQYKAGNFTYTGATAVGVYSAGSPVGAAIPDFNLAVIVASNGLSYTLSATANPNSTRAKDDGAYWYNPQGRNCYYANIATVHNAANCTAVGKEW